MFGYLLGGEPGSLDAQVRDVARGLRMAGLRVAGAVQMNPAGAAGRCCDMALQLLPSDRLIRISEDRGPLARGCRLDAGALEQAVAEVLALLDTPVPPQVLVLNKFGKQEAEGRGFRPVIAEALGRDIPVLVGVGPGNLEALEAFAGGMAQHVVVGQTAADTLAMAGDDCHLPEGPRQGVCPTPAQAALAWWRACQG